MDTCQSSSIARPIVLPDVEGSGLRRAFDKLYREAYGVQDILKLHLLGVATISGIGVSAYQLTAFCGLGPEFVVVKILLIGLAAGVVDVLNIYKNSDFVQRLPL